MLDIHHACVEHGGEGEQTNYVQGANIAGFVKVADAMLSEGRDLRQLCRIQRKRLIRP